MGTSANEWSGEVFFGGIPGDAFDVVLVAISQQQSDSLMLERTQDPTQFNAGVVGIPQYAERLASVQVTRR